MPPNRILNRLEIIFGFNLLNTGLGLFWKFFDVCRIKDDWETILRKNRDPKVILFFFAQKFTSYAHTEMPLFKWKFFYFLVNKITWSAFLIKSTFFLIVYCNYPCLYQMNMVCSSADTSSWRSQYYSFLHIRWIRSMKSKNLLWEHIRYSRRSTRLFFVHVFRLSFLS